MLKFSEMLESRRDKRDREDIMDVLKKYKDVPDMYVTFTDIEKLGINPKPKFDEYPTPNGIYAYPLKYVLKSIKDGDFTTFTNTKIPKFKWRTAKYVQVFKGKATDLSSYTEADLKRDIEKLKSVLKNVKASEWDSINIEREKDETYSEYERRRNEQIKNSRREVSVASLIDKIYKDNRYKPMKGIAWEKKELAEPASVLFYTVGDIAKRITAENPIEDHEMSGFTPLSKSRWNSILRAIGFDGMSDNRGVMSQDIKSQAVFFSSKGLELKETLLNPGHETISKLYDAKWAAGTNSETDENTLDGVLSKSSPRELKRVMSDLVQDIVLGKKKKALSLLAKKYAEQAAAAIMSSPKREEMISVLETPKNFDQKDVETLSAAAKAVSIKNNSGSGQAGQEQSNRTRVIDLPVNQIVSYFISHARGDRETGLKSFMSFRNRNWSKFNRAEQMKAEAAEQLFKRIVK